MVVSKREKYNEARKRETRRKLMEGVRAIAKTNTKVTKNALAKRTGVSRRIIDNYPEVLDAIEKANCQISNGIALTLSNRSVKAMSLEEAEAINIAICTELSEVTQKYNALLQKMTMKDSEIANLKTEVQELKAYLKDMSTKS